MTEGRSAARSDLPVRAASAVVMIAIAGTALWLGGPVWTVFVGLVAAGVLIEWSRLVMAFVPGIGGRLAWHIGGLVYVGLATAALLVLRLVYGPFPVLVAVGVVVAVDVCAYFFGRRFGGPKIAPAISPSKTWAGLGGAMLGAALVMYATHQADWRFAIVGVPVAVVAQAGDFFESWMKRRAGVKDSSRLIPGHGGLFDRVDGLIAVMFAVGLSAVLAGGMP
ncbi:MAG: phosphatidate cytidylyltransferase [Sphingomonadales bacterium]|nr:phosphatidate cytidylyltransferase [Sphingomonadales bacterium]